jgi:hypothetical protein
MAYQLQDGSTMEIKNKKDVIYEGAGEDEVSWSYAKGQCKIKIKNSYSGVIRNIDLPASTFHINNNSTFEAATMKGYIAGKDLVLFVKSLRKQNSTTIYKIDIIRKKVISRKTIVAEVNLYRGISVCKDMIYFHSWTQKDYTDENQKIQSFNTKNGKIQVMKRIPDGGFEDGIALDIVGGFLWIGMYSRGDGTGYWGTYSIPLN